MDYLKQLISASAKATNNTQTLGDYSPLSGFSNEDELDKNPYQQILSSQPKKDSTKFEISDFDKFLIEKGETTKVHDSFMKQSAYKDSFNKFLAKNGQVGLLASQTDLKGIVKDIDKRKKDEELKNLATSLGIDGINIDSTFYNRKDIYDIKERLDASGIDTPDKKKNKSGFWTRFFDLVSTPAYAIETAIYNATDKNKDTKVLKGLLDGAIGGITSNSDKYKDGSDLTDLWFGAQKEGASFTEKTGRFFSGLLLDVGLDPTTYMTFGTSALAKGTAKKIGKEVTEDAVKGAISGINNANELAKINKVLDVDKEAKRITNIINNKNAKAYDGLGFNIPFTKIEKEIISADKIADISNNLGLPKVTSKITDTTKAMWNANKSEDGIRATMEKIPDNLLGKIFNDADIRRTMKNNPLESAQLMAVKEANKQLDKFAKKVLPDTLPKIKELNTLMENMKEKGVDTSKIASIIEKLETNNYTKELDKLNVFNLVQDFNDEARRQLSLAENTKKSAYNKSFVRAQELLSNVEVDFNDIKTKVDNIKINDTQTDKNIADTTNFDYNVPTMEQINSEVRARKENIYDKSKDIGKQQHEIYQSVEAKQVVEELKSHSGMNSEQAERFINMPVEKQQKAFNNSRDTNVAKILGMDKTTYSNAIKDLGFEEFYNNVLNSKQYSKKRKDVLKEYLDKHSDIESKWFGAKTTKEHSILPNNGTNTVDSAISRLQSDKAKFESDKGFLEDNYVPATDYKGYVDKYEQEYDNYVAYQEKIKKIYSKQEDQPLPTTKKERIKIADTILNEMFKGLKGRGKNNSRAKMRNILIESMEKGMTYKDLPTVVERINKRDKVAIMEHIKKLADDKDLMLDGTNKGQQTLVEKFYEQKAVNTSNPHSKYYEDFRNGVNTNKNRNALFGNASRGTDGIWQELEQVAKRYSKITGEDELAKLNDGTSTLLEGTMASIYSKVARLNGDVKKTLTSEAQKYANNTIVGRGLKVKHSTEWDSEPIVRIKKKDGTYEQQFLRDINAKIRSDNKILIQNGKTPRRYKKITDFKAENIVRNQGLTQKLSSIIEDTLYNDPKVRKYLGEDLNKKFYDLPKDKQQALMKRAYDIVDKELDAPFWKGGDLKDIELRENKSINKAMLEEQNKFNSELSKQHELDFDQKNLDEETKTKMSRIEARNKKKGIMGGFSKDKGEHQQFVKELADLQTPERMFEYEGKSITYDELQEINKANKTDIKLSDLKEVHPDNYKMSKLNEMIEKEREHYKSLIRQIPTNSIDRASAGTQRLKQEIRYSLNRGLALKDEITYLKKNSSFYLHERKLTDLTNQEMVTKLKSNGIDLTGVNFKDKNALTKLMKDNDINIQEGIGETLQKQKVDRVESQVGQFTYKEEAKDFTLSRKDAQILNNLFDGDEKIMKPIYKSYVKDMDIKYLQESKQSQKIAKYIRTLPNKVDVKVKNIPVEKAPSKVDTLLKNNNIETTSKEIASTERIYADLTPDEINKSVTTNGSITIDLAKLTPSEMRDTLAQYGVQDKALDFHVENWKRQKAISEKAKKVLDFGKKEIISEDDLHNYLDTMEKAFGSDFVGLENKFYDNLKNKYDTMKVKSAKPKTAIEILKDNADIIQNELGGSKEAEEFVTKYTELMRGFASTEKEWGILKEKFDENGRVISATIDSHAYVPHRMSQEAMDKMGMTDGLDSIMEAFFKDRNNMKYNDTKFVKSRTLSLDGKSKTIEELNAGIRKYLKETKDIDIDNFFETDLTRLIIQRTYEHGDALYQKGVNNLFLNTTGTKFSWLKNKKGDLFEIIEDVNDGSMKYANYDDKGKYIGNDFKKAISNREFDKIRDSIDNFKPKQTYLSEDVLDKVKKEAIRNLNNLTDYINSTDNINEAKLENLKNSLYQNLPQRSLAREYKDMVKKGKLKLIYPEGEYKNVLVDVAKNGTMDDILSNGMFDSLDYKELSLNDFEKMTLQDKNVPVFAIDSKMYDIYVKSMKKQIKTDQNAFLEVYDKITTSWKKMATLSPGFHVRNVFGNFSQSFLDVGFKIFDPKYNNVTKAIMESSDEVIKGSDITGRQANELFENFFSDTKQLSNELNKTRRGRQSLEESLKEIKKSENLKSSNPFEFSRKVGDRIEQGAKRRHFGILLSEGMSPMEARDHVNKYLFDYSDLTDFETDVMKRIVPFYTFMRKNMELQLNTILEQPQTIKNAMRILENQREASVSSEQRKLLNDNDLTKIIIPLLNGKNVTWDTNIPWFDNKSMLGSLNPIIKTPLELATNKNLTFGNDIETYGGQVKEANPFEGLLGGLFGQTEIGADGKKYINSKAQHVITNLLPTVRTSDRMLGNFSNNSILSGLLASAGLGGQEFDETKRTSSQVREYKELLENIENKAQSKGINTREELKKKKELEELMSALGVLR